MQGHSLKVIKKTLAAAAKHGFKAVSYDKKTKLYQVEHNMLKQNMTFDQLSSEAYPVRRYD